MPSPLSTRKIWHRQIERVKAGKNPAAALRSVLLLSILKRRPNEMKKILAAARTKANEIPAELLTRIAQKYPEPSVTFQLARLHHNADRPETTLTILDQFTPSPNLTPGTFDLWSQLVLATHQRSQKLQISLEAAIAQPGSHHSQLCTIWINFHQIFPNPTTVTNHIANHIADASPTLLTKEEQSLLLHTLTLHPDPTPIDLPAAELPTPTSLLLVTLTRDSLPNLATSITDLTSRGHTVRTLALDCLQRRDRFWVAGSQTRPLKDPSLRFLGDQRLTSLRLLNRLLASSSLVLVPQGDPASSFLSSLPQPIRPNIASIE